MLTLPACILDKNWLLTRMTDVMSYNISFIITLKHWHYSWSLPFPQTPGPINQQAFLILPSKYMANLLLMGCWDPVCTSLSLPELVRWSLTDLSQSLPPSSKAHLPSQSSHSHKSNPPEILLLKTFQKLPTVSRMKSKLLPKTWHFLHDLAPARPYKTISYSLFLCSHLFWHRGSFCLLITHKYVLYL